MTCFRSLFVIVAAVLFFTVGQANAGLVVTDAANDSTGPASTDILNVAINNNASAYDVSMTLAAAPDNVLTGFYGVLFSTSPTISTSTGSVYATMPNNLTAVKLYDYFAFGGVTPTVSANTLTWHVTGLSGANNDASLYALLSSGSYSFTGITGMMTNPSTYDTTDTKTVTPIPGAVWLFGTGLLGLIGLRRRTQATNA